MPPIPLYSILGGFDQAKKTNPVDMRTRIEMKALLDDGRPRAPDFLLVAGAGAPDGDVAGADEDVVVGALPVPVPKAV
jgi:hypothetical protein